MLKLVKFLPGFSPTRQLVQKYIFKLLSQTFRTVWTNGCFKNTI